MNDLYIGLGILAIGAVPLVFGMIAGKIVSPKNKEESK